MSFPPPPPDRMHLQYQPQPPQAQHQVQQSGPAGAYGPVQQRPDQPIPGQLPPPEMTMRKPGTITGIQVILWIFMALAGLGDIASAISLVEYFTAFGLIGLAWAVYSTIQALVSGVHITRGKRWAWIWSLVSAIIGLVISAAAIVFGIIYIEVGWISLLVGIVLGGLYGTLLGLLCSKSARQWILMHRIRRGEVQLPGTAGTAGGSAHTAEGREGPQRPEKRPGSATFAVTVSVLLMALTAWAVFGNVWSLVALGSGGMAPGPTDVTGMIFGSGLLLIMAAAGFAVLVCALFSAIGLARGRFGPRVFTIVWTSVMGVVWVPLAITQFLQYMRYRDFALPGQEFYQALLAGRNLATALLVVVLFIMVLTPGVRAWTPGRPPTALIVVVPQAQGPGQGQAPY
ncbi:hypothetical protein [Glycomyces albidus]|uniref:hypothetical protein n=1 Tax=Glycomyces albidus TaxID=2656774 RepID=UPI00188349EC|nr:hypothetical protein [Glycomyces albidus]